LFVVVAVADGGFVGATVHGLLALRLAFLSAFLSALRLVGFLDVVVVFLGAAVVLFWHCGGFFLALWSVLVL